MPMGLFGLPQKWAYCGYQKTIIAFTSFHPKLDFIVNNHVDK
jgi:hypothetical protein